MLAGNVPFFSGDPLDLEEVGHYSTYETDVEDGTLYELCCRVVDKGLTAEGHSLPLIGSGDWNDGINRVGTAGRGESIWMV